MYFYINPPDCTKEKWLTTHGRPMLPDEDPITSTELAVCLVDNGTFNVAGIAYSAMEFERFHYGLAGRRAWWFMVPRAKLVPPICAKLPEDISCSPAPSSS